MSILTKIFSDSTEKASKKHQPLVDKIGAFESKLEGLTDEQLKAKTAHFRLDLENGSTLDDLLPEAFAVVREAAKRTLGLRHYDVQLMGGIVLHEGKIAEMKTGEGKTLAATLPVYLNALRGRGVHVVTVNDYLAKRDTVWMGAVYRLLGLSIACLQHDAAYLYDPDAENPDPSLQHLTQVTRAEAYRADITHGTNNEFGFDYLRDNMVVDPTLQVQRERNYAIVDEVDNILVDEARTPLIISGPAEEPVQLYYTVARLAPSLDDSDYSIDDKTNSVSLHPSGISKLEKALNVQNLYDAQNYHLVHYVENALTAHIIKKRDKDYVVRDGQVIIVDEFTGRLQPGRRWSDGLHQAVEAKEGLKVQRESITYATITLQNYFRMYDKLAGMTGTAATESEEFFKIYGLDVVAIPTHWPMIREDFSDLIYKTVEGKWNAVVKDLQEVNATGRPILVGTTSIESSERLGSMLKRNGTPHEVLNAKQHEREAHIVAQAGKPGSITVATNMAGRGTDIVLGGNPESLDIPPDEWERDHNKVVELGGLYVVGTEHHDARRIDNQLRGRSGRQGDPGSSRFYSSLEDDLLRRFGGDRIKGLMGMIGLDEETPIENRIVTKSLESAQVKVEGHHFEVRKHLLEYDDVLNNQRKIIYDQRTKALRNGDLKGSISEMVEQEIGALVSTHLPGKEQDGWDADGLLAELNTIFPIPRELDTEEKVFSSSKNEIRDRLVEAAHQAYSQRETLLGDGDMRTLERLLMLRTSDVHWVQHLTTMDNLRQGIGLHAYGQRDPLVMYKSEGSKMFQQLQDRMQQDIVHTIFNSSLGPPQGGSRGAPKDRPDKPSPMQAASGRQKENGLVGNRKVGRNDPCPCGSGKKYKRCHAMAA